MFLSLQAEQRRLLLRRSEGHTLEARFLAALSLIVSTPIVGTRMETDTRENERYHRN